MSNFKKHPMANNRFSFKKGFMQVKNKDIAAVRQEIMQVLNISTRMAWSVRLNGKVEPKVTEAEAIEAVFNKYGVTEVWGGSDHE